MEIKKTLCRVFFLYKFNSEFVPLKKGEITAANAAALSGKLLQMANGTVYSNDGDEIVIHDQKLDALEDMMG